MGVIKFGLYYFGHKMSEQSATNFQEKLDKPYEFTVYSQNCQYDGPELEIRALWLACSIRSKNADVLCLQELSHVMIEQVEKHGGFDAYPNRSTVPDRGYFTMMYSKETLPLQIVRRDFECGTEMGRDYVEGSNADLKICIRTSHCESLDKADRRCAQHREMLVETGNDGGAWATYFVGDTNLTDIHVADQEFVSGLASMGYIDAWQLIHPTNPNIMTRDPAANPNAATKAVGRFDRVFHNSKAIVSDISLVLSKGDVSHPDLRISDHWGLFFEIGSKHNAETLAKARTIIAEVSQVNQADQTQTPEIDTAFIKNLITLVERTANAYNQLMDLFKAPVPGLQMGLLFKPLDTKLQQMARGDERQKLGLNTNLRAIAHIYRTAIVDRTYGADYAIEQKLERIVDVWGMDLNKAKHDMFAIESAMGELMRGLLSIINEVVWLDPSEIAGQAMVERLAFDKNVQGFVSALAGDAPSFVLLPLPATSADKGCMVDIWGADDADGVDIG